MEVLVIVVLVVAFMIGRKSGYSQAENDSLAGPSPVVGGPVSASSAMNGYAALASTSITPSPQQAAMDAASAAATNRHAMVASSDPNGPPTAHPLPPATPILKL